MAVKFRFCFPFSFFRNRSFRSEPLYPGASKSAFSIFPTCVTCYRSERVCNLCTCECHASSCISPRWLVACPGEKSDRSLWQRSPHTLCILAGIDPHNPPSVQTQPGFRGDGEKSMNIYECVSVWVRGKGVGVKRQHGCIMHKKNRWIWLNAGTWRAIFKGPVLVCIWSVWIIHTCCIHFFSNLNL